MKRKTFRERYEDNYRAVSIPAQNKKGFKVRYVYYKPWHIWDLPYGELKNRKILMGVAFALSLSIFVFAGIQYTPVNFDRFVGIPVMLSVCAFLFQAVGICQFCAYRHKTTDDNYHDVTYKMMFATISGTVLLYIAAIGCVARMTSDGFSLRGVLVATGYMAAGLLSLYIRKLYREIPYRTEANMSLAGYDANDDDDRS